MTGRLESIDDDEAQRRYPKTLKILKKYADTTESRKRRVIDLRIRAGEISGWTEQDAERLKALSDHEIAKLWNRLRSQRYEHTRS